jgi:syntaxin-binding protein 1
MSTSLLERHYAFNIFVFDGIITQLSHAVVENVAVKREPLPKMSGVYFITPTIESVNRVIEDFQNVPLYKFAHVFFSSPAQPMVLAAIRSAPGLTSRLRSLKEVSPFSFSMPFNNDTACSRVQVICLEDFKMQKSLGLSWQRLILI